MSELLARLDPNPVIAEQRYLQLHGKLTFYFTHKRCSDPENLAGEVLDRAQTRCAAGVAIDAEVESFCFGIAKHVLQEQWRSDAKIPQVPLDPETLPLQAAGRPEAAWNMRILVRELMAQLRPEDRRVVHSYFFQENEGMERNLGLTRKGLRTRVHRILGRLRARVAEAGSGGRNAAGDSHRER